MFKKLKIISIAVFCLLFLVTITFNTKHLLSLETGEQKYIRSVLGIEVKSLSETAYFECGSWQNPLPNQKGEVVLRSCSGFSCKTINAVEIKC